MLQLCRSMYVMPPSRWSAAGAAASEAAGRTAYIWCLLRPPPAVAQLLCGRRAGRPIRDRSLRMWGVRGRATSKATGRGTSAGGMKLTSMDQRHALEACGCEPRRASCRLLAASCRLPRRPSHVWSIATSTGTCHQAGPNDQHRLVHAHTPLPLRQMPPAVCAHLATAGLRRQECALRRGQACWAASVVRSQAACPS